MTLDELFLDKKTLTVSGLYPGIGKTLFSEHIISLVPDIAALKITMTDGITRVTDDEQSIMVTGKDTFRLKSSGAKKVVWVKARKEDLESAVRQAIARIPDSKKILFEGNSILSCFQPVLAFFLCDKTFTSLQNIKPSRLESLEKADIIVYNIRDKQDTGLSATKKICSSLNSSAPVIPVCCSDRTLVGHILKGPLSQHGFL